MKNILLKSVAFSLLATGFAGTLLTETNVSPIQSVAKAAETIVKEYKQSFPTLEEYNTKGKLFDIVDENSHFPVKNAIVKFKDGSEMTFTLNQRPSSSEENEPITKEIKEITYNGEERGVQETIALENLDNLDPKSFDSFYNSIFFDSYPDGTKITLTLEDGQTVKYTIGESLDSTGIDNAKRILIKKAVIETP